MADNTTELEVLDQIVDVLGGQSGQYETVVPVLQQIKELLAAGITDPEAIAEAVAAWLDEHPEATTTVEDGAITTAKLADGAVTDAKLAQTGGVLSVVNELKTTQPNLFFHTGVNKVSRSWFTNGKRIGGNGGISDLATACCTEEYIDISNVTETYLAAYYTGRVDKKPLRTYAYIAFYDENKSMVLYNSAGSASNMAGSFIAIPATAKYFRITFGALTTSDYGFMVIFTNSNETSALVDYEPYEEILAVVPADLDAQLDQIGVLQSVDAELTGASFVHHDMARQTITQLNGSYTFNQNDITIVKDELWLSKQSAIDYVNGTKIFRYKVIDGAITLVGTIDCDFGHLNVVDYSEKNDCLIFGNGANDEGTTGNYFVVVKNPLALGSEALIEDVGIKYDVNVGFKVNALWGDDNFGEANIVVLLSNNLQTITKLMLNRDSNGDFDGTYITLEQQTNLEVFGVQGADIWGDNLYVGGQVGSNEYYAIKVISLSDYTTSKVIKRKRYKADGTAYFGTVQGIYVGQSVAWVFCNSNAPQTGVCCFLTQYRK